jgi:hypothetical protein
MVHLFACLEDGNKVLIGTFPNKGIALRVALSVCPEKRIRVQGVWFDVVSMEIA